MRLFCILALLLVAACTPKPQTVPAGTWRGVIELQGQQMPFLFEVTNDGTTTSAALINDTERIALDEISYSGDSVRIVMHIFDVELRAKVSGDQLTGYYYKNYDPAFKLKFTATRGDSYLFATNDSTRTTDFSGTYAATFISDSQDTTVAVGILRQQGNQAFGTYLTPTGDYRYLSGNVIGDKLFLSTFDGNHAFLFTAVRNADGSLTGDFWSGRASHEQWTGIPDAKAKLPDAEALTYLKPGYDKMSFSFPDVSGKPVSLDDPKYKGKVIVLQLFGTWCPNCMDETKFLGPWYDQNKDRGVEIIGLAYERKPEFDYASGRVRKMIQKLNVHYDFLIAGTSDKEKAAETLPMLNKVVAFPTTIFIGKDGKVRHIRTGFEGPGTGIYYERHKERFNEIINELLSEKAM
ncbi:MAG: TlpA family protein disulfide reductase [Cyclobacteriaceae bacterium]|nr:TlpA family protein disulfide reductase [Cyclobacteriaceae bacterium]